MSEIKNILGVIDSALLNAEPGTASINIATEVKKYLFNHFRTALKNAQTEEELLLIKKLWADIEGR